LTAIEVTTGDAGARRALVLHDRQLMVDLIELTLNHGLFVVRAATSLAEADSRMPSASRLARLARAATLPETRGLIVAAARSNSLRGLVRRAVEDRAGLLRDLRHPGHPRDLIRAAARHPATRELADVGLVFLPIRYMPLSWVAKWATARVLRRFINRPVQSSASDGSKRSTNAP
jgi:hypothetical protein